MKKSINIAYLAFIFLFLYLPIAVLIVLSFNESRSMYKWEGFSLKWYVELFDNPLVLEAVVNTFVIAIVAATIATIIGTAACLGIMNLSSKQRNVLLGFNNIPLLNADIVTGIALLLTFVVFGITLNQATVILSHITFCIPYVILSVMPHVRQMNVSTYEAALDLGASRRYAFFKVAIPEIKAGIISGFLIALTMSVDDFVITYFTKGAGINTISTMVYSMSKVGIRPTFFVLSTIIFVIVFIILVISNFILRKGESR